MARGVAADAPVPARLLAREDADGRGRRQARRAVGDLQQVADLRARGDDEVARDLRGVVDRWARVPSELRGARRRRGAVLSSARSATVPSGNRYSQRSPGAAPWGTRTTCVRCGMLGGVGDGGAADV